MPQEPASTAPKPRLPFHLHVTKNALLSAGVIIAALLVGIGGYMLTEGMSLVDALLNASMILTGMGPATPLKTTAGKLFASGYALFSGTVFLSAMALLFAPWLHRFLHRFHLDLEESRRTRPGK